MRGASQNARFFRGGDGEDVAAALAIGLAARGVAATPPAPWHGDGWRIVCLAGASELEITLTSSGGDEWSIQVAPARQLSLSTALRAPQLHPAAADVHRAAAAVHAVLAEHGGCQEVRWRWDGVPTGGDAAAPAPL